MPSLSRPEKGQNLPRSGYTEFFSGERERIGVFLTHAFHLRIISKMIPREGKCKPIFNTAKNAVKIGQNSRLAIPLQPDNYPKYNYNIFLNM